MMIESVFLLLMIIGNISWKGNCQTTTPTPPPDAEEHAARNFESTNEPARSTDNFWTPEEIRDGEQLLQDHLLPLPASPISEGREPVEKGMNISWNSKEEKFEISHMRNDTGEIAKTSTVKIHINITTYGFGAWYTVNVETISNRLSSEPSSEFEADLPKPSSIISLYKYWVWFREWETMATVPEVTDYTIRYRTEGNSTWQLLPKPSSKIVDAVIDNVTPGERYILRFNTVSHGVENSESREHQLVIPPNPVLTMNMTPTSDSTNIILKWLRPKGRIETYVIKWWPLANITDIHTKNVAEDNVIDTDLKDSDQMREVLINELISGVEYSISIHTVNSYNVVSDVTNFKIRTVPEQVSGIRAVDIHDTNMTLEWDIPRGEYDTFEVQYTSLNEMMEEILMKNITDCTSMTITGLRPYRNYSYTFTVISGTESAFLTRSKPVSAIFTTSESRPEKIVSFNTLEIRPTDITFEWSLPIEKQNGIIRRFSITYGLQGSTQTKVKSFEPNEFWGVIGSLTPAETYEFNIQAETIIGLGPAKTLQQRMPSISALPQAKPTNVPVKFPDNSTMIEVAFYDMVSPGSNLHGQKSRVYILLTLLETFFKNAIEKDTNSKPEVVTMMDMLNFGRQIATGMEFLSASRIVHRDLAARNILVCHDRTVKIFDFGLSRDIYCQNIYKKWGNGQMPLKWMAIEALIHQIYTTCSDVWSFGILLWEIVTRGGEPYPGVPTLQILKQLQSGYRMERPENYSIDLYKVMRSCWLTRTKDRPTFTVLRQELDKLVCATTESEYFDLNDVSEGMPPQDDDAQTSISRHTFCPLQVTVPTDLEPPIAIEVPEGTMDEPEMS